MQAKKRVERKVVELPENSNAIETINNMMTKKHQTRKPGNPKQCHVVKPEPVKTLTACENDFLQSKFGTAEHGQFNTSAKVIHNRFAMYSLATKKVKKQNSYTIRLYNGSALEVDRYLLHLESGDVFASGRSIELSASILPNRVQHIQKMIVQHPSVVNY